MDFIDARAHTFDTIVGQDVVKRFLLRACAQGRLPHALLFTGPAGVGKRSLMFALAKHLVTVDCEAGGEKARLAEGKVERGTHPDVMVVEPRSASGQILKSQVDEMHDRAHYAPLESPHKVILITPIEAMNLVAANKLLKLLEEPPPSLYLLLSSPQPHMTLATIRSRCALVRCPPVEFEPLADWLAETAQCPRRKAETAAVLSGGRPGAALELVSGEYEERRRRVQAEMDFFHREGYPSIFRVGRNILEAAGGKQEALAILFTWFRDLLVASLTSGESGVRDDGAPGLESPDSLLINRDLASEIVEKARDRDPGALARALEVVLEYNGYLSRPFLDADLLMEVFLTDLGMALK